MFRVVPSTEKLTYFLEKPPYLTFAGFSTPLLTVADTSSTLTPPSVELLAVGSV